MVALHSLSSGWVLADGLAAFLLSFLLIAGPALLFAVAASILSFHYSVVGLWLPILSYFSAGIALILDFRLAERLDQPAGLDMEKDKKSEESIAKFNYEEWSHQLAGIVDELGMHSPEIEIRVYHEHTYDPKATPLFTARPNDLHATLSRLRDDFGGGTYWVIVFVRGEIRRRFTLLVNT